MKSISTNIRMPFRVARWRSGASFVLAPIGIAACILCSGAQSADTAAVVDTARAALERYVEIRRVISHERRDWALGRQMLNERIGLVQEEIASLREKITEDEQTISTTDEKRAELVSENERLKAAASVLASEVSDLEQRTCALLKRLPAPILERVEPLSQRLPDDPEATELPLSERYMTVVGILNDINKFNREMTLASEVRTLPDGTTAEVASLYVGIGQGYYVGANASVAGVGTASPEGWVWRPVNDAAPQIARAVAILQNEQVASFVLMPVDIR